MSIKSVVMGIAPDIFCPEIGCFGMNPCPKHCADDEYEGTRRNNSIASYDLHRYKEDALAIHGDADFYKGAHRKFGW